MTDHTAAAVIPRESSWPVATVDELADALFGPEKDWQKADHMVSTIKHSCTPEEYGSHLCPTSLLSPQVEQEMERPAIDMRTQFLVRQTPSYPMSLGSADAYLSVQCLL